MELEERYYEIGRGAQGWSVVIRDSSGAFISAIPVDGTKQDAIALCAEMETTYKHNYAMDFLRQALPVGSELVIVWKYSRPQHNLYSVFVSWNNQVICLDQYINDARIANYVYRKNNTCGVEAYGAGNLANAISSKLTGEPRSYRWTEVQ